MVNSLEELFPRLLPGAYQITSPAHDRYNCIAWAAGDTSIWWWPINVPNVYWPSGVPKEESLDAFLLAFASLGYEACEGEQLEQGFEKIALFADAEGVPSHAARQLLNGRWASKLGAMEDIEHPLHDLEGELYGTVVRIVKRPRPLSQGASD